MGRRIGRGILSLVADIAVQGPKWLESHVKLNGHQVGNQY